MSTDIQTHGPIVTNIALLFAMLSPLIGAILSLIGGWFLSQATG